MTYFGVPRLHFSGSFYIDPSTINNTDSNYNEPPVLQKAWNPTGTHFFQLLAGNEPVIPPGATVTPCEVTGIVTEDGKFTNDPSKDSLIGQLLVSTNNPAPAKLVDLDVDQQLVSQVWGLQLSIGATGQALIADFIATNFQQMFGARAPGNFAAGFSAAYQSQLTNLQWPSSIDSPLLQAWQNAGAQLLSIRFTVDQIDAPALPTDPNFRIGRISGTIGLSSASEPQSITIGRLLRPVTAFTPPTTSGAPKELQAGMPAPPDDINQNFNYAPALVDSDRNVVTIDLGNALPFDTGGNPANAGTLKAAILTSSGVISLGPVTNTLDHYLQRAFLFEFPLDDNGTTAGTSPLVILSNGNVVLSENPSGAWIDAAEHVYRLDANAPATEGTVGATTTAEVTLYATTFGATPAAGQTVTLGVSEFANSQTGNPWPAPAIPLTISPSSVTLTNGMATFTIYSGMPGNPRGSIDGLVYRITFDWAQDTNPVSRLAVCVKVFDALRVPVIFDKFQAPKPPHWIDVQGIFQQYMTLYPAMKAIMDLSDETTVNTNAAAIMQYLSFPITSPLHMPVTRDLSTAMREYLLRYLAAQLPPKGGGD
ncbi:MAG TPA: hypothetical protein VEK57_17395 [Thermoanaerobaculia bacterium]|nr:hypothetical protein [Thermoanaerobaculia bacterium]